jgi:hypothetical protein
MPKRPRLDLSILTDPPKAPEKVPPTESGIANPVPSGRRTKRQAKQKRPDPRGFKMRDLYTLADGRLGKQLSTVQKVAGAIERGQCVHIVSMASWSVEHVIAHYLDQIGPAHLALATWAISSNAAVKVRRGLDAGAILSARMVLDIQLNHRRPEAYDQITQALDSSQVRSYPCHAKCYLLHAPAAGWHVTVVGSQNYTTNPRVELLVVTEGKEIHDFHAAWIDELLARGEPFARVSALEKRRKT